LAKQISRIVGVAPVLICSHRQHHGVAEADEATIAEPDSVTEEQARRRSWQIFDLVNAAIALMDTNALWPAVEKGSRMARLNKKTNPVHMAHYVQLLIGVALEHLHAIGALRRDANMIHNSPPFTLARSAVEAAATAHWILQPTDSWHEQIKRLVIYLRQDRYDYQQVAELFQRIRGGDLPEDLAKKGERIDKVIADNRLDIRSRTDLKMTEILMDVDKTTGGSTNFEIYWRTASGLAHARQWAQLAMFRRGERFEIEPGVAAVRLSSDERLLGWSVETAYSITNRAMKLFNEACRAPLR